MSPKYKTIDSHWNTPGPGQYIRFSEFGILAPKKKKEKVHSRSQTMANKDMENYNENNEAKRKKKPAEIDTKNEYDKGNVQSTDNATIQKEEKKAETVPA